MPRFVQVRQNSFGWLGSAPSERNSRVDIRNEGNQKPPCPMRSQTRPVEGLRSRRECRELDQLDNVNARKTRGFLPGIDIPAFVAINRAFERRSRAVLDEL
jgi:hypothetical protein